MEFKNIDLSFELNLKVKDTIRQTKINKTIIGGDSSVPFVCENENKTKPLIALEFPFFEENSYPEILKKIWNCKTPLDCLKKANDSDADIISIKFNVSEEYYDKQISEIKSFLDKLHTITEKTIILRGANNNDLDKKLIPLLSEYKTNQVIIAFAEEDTFETIVPNVIKNNHMLILRTPIDINIAKELNILTIDKGLAPERIIIDPDMGGLGYGLDYGYSIIEKIRQAAFDGDTMLNMPIIAFIGEETYRAKEAKTNTFNTNWGDYKQRATMWEISGATAMLCAGANIVVLWNPESVTTLKGIL